MPTQGLKSPRLPTRRHLLIGGTSLGLLAFGGFGRTAEAPGASALPAPDYALPPYDPQGETIPPDALDAADYPSLTDWLNAMELEGRPGKISSGTYDARQVGRRHLYTSIYGYGETRPVLRVIGAPFALYLSADQITIQYLRFETLALAIAYVDRGGGLMVSGEWRSADLEGSERPGSSALEHDSDITGIRIADCEFACVLPIAFMSQYHRLSDIHIARNKTSGGAGFCCILSDRFNGIRVYENEITYLNQGNLRGNHVGTAIWIGSIIDNSANFPANFSVYIENNLIENVTASGKKSNTNSGVGIDVREASEVVIRGNIMRNVLNTAGHVDSNGIYAKSSVLMEYNLIENCGSAAGGKTIGEAGSEGSLLTFKGGSRCHSTIRNNTFLAGTRTDVPLILTSHMALIEDNRFVDWRYSGDHMNRDSMIRTYSGGPVTVGRCEFVNCGTASGNAHRGYAVGEVRGGTVTVQTFASDFDEGRPDIFHGNLTIENCATHYGTPMTVGYDQATRAILDAAQVEVTQAQGVAMDFLIRDLKFREIWTRLESLHLLYTPEIALALVDWRVPDRALSVVGAPVFTPFAGYTATADGQKLVTGYNPVVAGLPVDDCMILAAARGTNVRSNRNSCGNAGLSLVHRNTLPADVHSARLATGAGVNFAAPVTSALGIHAVQRRNSGTVAEHFREGTLLGTAATQAAAHHDSALTILARADVKGCAPYTVWAFAAGRSLTPLQHNQLRFALNKYRQEMFPDPA
jgi:hypothetical protein